jgi:hypothetical protein
MFNDEDYLKKQMAFGLACIREPWGFAPNPILARRQLVCLHRPATTG